MFLTVILLEKFNLFQINGIYSKSIFLPLFGDLGRIKLAGTFFRFFMHINIAVPQIQKTHIKRPIKLKRLFDSYINFGIKNNFINIPNNIRD